MSCRWFESHQTLVELAGWLVEIGHFTMPKQVVDFFEKPWHYEEEWQAYLGEQQATMIRDES